MKGQGALEMAVEALANPDLPPERRQELKAQALAAAGKLRSARDADPDGAVERHTELLSAIKGPVRRSAMTADEKVDFVSANGSDAFLALPA